MLCSIEYHVFLIFLIVCMHYSSGAVLRGVGQWRRWRLALLAWGRLTLRSRQHRKVHCSLLLPLFKSPPWKFPRDTESKSPLWQCWRGVRVSPKALLCITQIKLPAIMDLLLSAEDRPFALTAEEPCHYCMHNGCITHIRVL